MTRTVVVADYGVGNLLSVCRAVEFGGGTPICSPDPDVLRSAERLVLPGVGAFGNGMQELIARGLAQAIREFTATGRPLLGICLGMQLLFDASEEFGPTDGLGLIPGAVSGLPDTDADGKRHKIPHIGWNTLTRPQDLADWNGTLLEETPTDASFYFVHSFSPRATNSADNLAFCTYNGRVFTAAVQHENIVGVQFHPEKSGPRGLALIERFITTS